MRPSWILAALEERQIERTSVMLLDCDEATRKHRLIEGRRQPEPASPDMFKWAAYLMGQADALKLQIVDTSQLSLEEVADEIARSAEMMLVDNEPEAF